MWRDGRFCSVIFFVEKEARIKAETERINRERKEQKKAEKERRRKEYEAKMERQKEEKPKRKRKGLKKDNKPGMFVSLKLIIQIIRIFHPWELKVA